MRKIVLQLDDTLEKRLTELAKELRAKDLGALVADALGAYVSLHELLQRHPGQELGLYDRADTTFQRLHVRSFERLRLVKDGD